MNHLYLTPENCGCQKDGHCMICDGGLGVCKTCGCFEGSLATECPGVECYAEYGERIYRGEIDFRNGRWVEGVLTVHMGGKMRFVIRSSAGFYYHGIGGFGHRVFCDDRSEARVFEGRKEAEQVKDEIDAIPDRPNQSLKGLEVVPA